MRLAVVEHHARGPRHVQHANLAPDAVAARSCQRAEAHTVAHAGIFLRVQLRRVYEADEGVESRGPEFLEVRRLTRLGESVLRARSFQSRMPPANFTDTFAVL